MESKIKLLQISPQFPFREDDGGKIGISSIFKEFLKNNIELTFFCFVDEDTPLDLIDKYKSQCEFIFFKHSTKNSYNRILKSLLTNKPIYIQKHYNSSIRKFILDIAKDKKFDMVHVDHSAMDPLAMDIKKNLNIPYGLMLHNVEWGIWQRYADSLNKFSAKRIYIEHQAKLLKKFESVAYSNADVCFALSESEKQKAIETSKNSNIVISQVGVFPEKWVPSQDTKRNPYEIVNATTYHWVHNLNAVKWFIENVQPILYKYNSNIKLTLIGKNSPDWFNNHRNIGVEPIGYVDKVQPYYHKANVSISPLFVGGGLRIKILEAMASELPVVASSISAEGIMAGEAQGLFRADTVQDFADKVIYLCNNFDVARKLGKAAREFISNNYTWSITSNIICNEYRKILGK